MLALAWLASYAFWCQWRLPLGLLMRLRVLLTWLRLRLDVILQVWLLSEVPLMILMRLGLLLLCWITPMSGRMEALSLIGSLVSLHLVLGSLLTSLKTVGVVVGGVMLMVFDQVEKFPLVEVSVLFLGLSSLYRKLI